MVIKTSIINNETGNSIKHCVLIIFIGSLYYRLFDIITFLFSGFCHTYEVFLLKNSLMLCAIRRCTDKSSSSFTLTLFRSMNWSISSGFTIIVSLCCLKYNVTVWLVGTLLLRNLAPQVTHYTNFSPLISFNLSYNLRFFYIHVNFGLQLLKNQHSGTLEGLF